MKSWPKHLNGFEVKEWNEKNFDIASHPFAQKAYAAKKWAFVSDYIRAYVIYNEGGVYFDTDIVMADSIDDLLQNDAFVGYETPDYPFTAVFGAKKKHPLLKSMLDYYDSLDLDTIDFKQNDNNTISVSDILINTYDCEKGDIEQSLKNGIHVYRSGVLCNPSRDSRTIHLFNRSWRTDGNKFKENVNIFVKSRLSSRIRVIVYLKLKQWLL